MWLDPFAPWIFTPSSSSSPHLPWDICCSRITGSVHSRRRSQNLLGDFELSSLQKASPRVIVRCKRGDFPRTTRSRVKEHPRPTYTKLQEERSVVKGHLQSWKKGCVKHPSSFYSLYKIPKRKELKH